MAKNKNRNKQVPQNTQQPKTTQSVKPTLTVEQKLEIEAKQEELQTVQPVEQLTQESETKLRENEAKEDLSRYWTYVKEINKRLEALMISTKDEKDKTTKLKDEFDASKKEADGIKADFKKKIEDYNKKDKELTEREFALDNGEYTAVIRRLLDTIKDTEKRVFTDTENLLKELSEFHKKNLEEFSGHIKESAEFEKQQAELKKEKRKFEVEKQIFKDDLQDNFETKYSEQLNLKTAELGRIQRKATTLEQENANLKQLFEDLQNAFESNEPQEILIRHSFLTKELENHKRELKERPEQFELETKQAKIEELQAKVVEYQTKINEGELLELKRILSNMDSYVIEINAYKNQIESAKVREASLKKTIDDLSITIDQLKGESTKKADAFEFGKNCDADTRNLGYNHLQQKKDAPSNLADLTSYVQQWMAFKSDKPFYYSLETIRIFLSGLNMSPISILQGISGTGKTSLPREFAKALVTDGYYVGVDDDNQNKAPYRICAVQSGWRDNMDLMGYYNSFEHKYKETDFFKALYIANQPKYSDTLFLIILDEMNLSRPEHYFADFLSLLEQSPSERYIGLSNTPNEVLPTLIKGGKLKIPENVRFVGTANHDETTLEFAPKTYDRSNLMEMPKNHPDKKDFRLSEASFNVKYSWLKDKFEKAEQHNKESFNKFHLFINSDDIKILLTEKGIGIGNRLEFQAEKFISVFVESGKDKEKDVAIAVDHLISSRLFRTLKNRYDLDKANLTKFKDDYVKLFHNSFMYQPGLAVELLNNEISKK
ncbi:hypothetical protein [Aquiflexum gelatinilyticum]|uniref:hypothetical protein n=1 Tax=Aquiflexum gelatinilyticum TaxID=2961943 RepID=UPI0021686C6E|nr:hypothetical protein [Aquiflexum gelatinilyticum]MCS4432850.1 hypothetical protein [Aquiflexum gelatinilyticum]